MLEVTDAFLDKDHAIGLTTGVSEDVEHISDSGRLVIEPDKMFSSVLQSVIEQNMIKQVCNQFFRFEVQEFSWLVFSPLSHRPLK